MTTRRQVLLGGTGSVFAAALVFAQGHSATIGFLTARRGSSYDAPLLKRLAELGYAQPRMRLEVRDAEGVAERFPKLARELVDAKCDLIFAIGPEQPALALQGTRSQIPIVFLAVDYDPLEKGIVTNLRRPGGNLTGVYVPALPLVVKRMELAQEVLPGARRFLVFSDPYTGDQLARLRHAAAGRGVELKVVEFTKPPYDFAAALEAGRRADIEAFISLNSPIIGAAVRGQLGPVFASQRIAAFTGATTTTAEGILVSYSTDAYKVGRRAAEIAARILKGTKPGDIPVEQADEFELVVNLKIAKALGVKVPMSVLARATRVIE